MVRSLLALFLAISLATFAVAAEKAAFELSGKNTKIEFVGKKKDGSHAGGFKTLSGVVTLTDAADPATASLKVTIAMDSLYSDDAKLTAHLKNPDFFEVKKFPEATFEVTKIAVSKEKEGYMVSGNLSLHGQTKKLSFPAAIESSAAGFKLTAKFPLHRSEWGISYGKGQIEEVVDMTVNIDAKAK